MKVLATPIPDPFYRKSLLAWQTLVIRINGEKQVQKYFIVNENLQNIIIVIIFGIYIVDLLSKLLPKNQNRKQSHIHIWK